MSAQNERAEELKNAFIEKISTDSIHWYTSALALDFNDETSSSETNSGPRHQQYQQFASLFFSDCNETDEAILEVFCEHLNNFNDGVHLDLHNMGDDVLELKMTKLETDDDAVFIERVRNLDTYIFPAPRFS